MRMITLCNSAFRQPSLMQSYYDTNDMLRDKPNTQILKGEILDVRLIRSIQPPALGVGPDQITTAEGHQLADKIDILHYIKS